MDQRLLIRGHRRVSAGGAQGARYHAGRDGEKARLLVGHALSALETGKNVSAIKVDRYLQQLGFRMVIVPKGADVEVTE